MSKPRILVNVFHPDIKSSRCNKILMDTVGELENVTCRDVYSECRDFKINVKHEQKLLVDHDLIVFQFPFYWYSGPSLLKEWQDKVLEPDFAFLPAGGDWLKGKHWLTVLSTGARKDVYRSGGLYNYTISELLRPFQQTADICGLKWLPPLVIYSVLPEGSESYFNVTNEEISNFANTYKKYLDEYTME